MTDDDFGSLKKVISDAENMKKPGNWYILKVN